MEAPQTSIRVEQTTTSETAQVKAVGANVNFLNRIWSAVKSVIAHIANLFSTLFQFGTTKKSEDIKAEPITNDSKPAATSKKVEDVKATIDYSKLSPEERFEKAKELVKSAPQDLCENIDKFSLSEKQVNTIADSLYLKEQVTLLNNLEKFKLTPEKRGGLAQMLFNDDPKMFMVDFAKFDLELPERYRLAGMALVKYTEAFLHYFDNFDLAKNPDVIKRCALPLFFKIAREEGKLDMLQENASKFRLTPDLISEYLDGAIWDVQDNRRVERKERVWDALKACCPECETVLETKKDRFKFGETHTTPKLFNDLI